MEVSQLYIITSKQQYFEYCDLLESLTIEDEDKYEKEINTLELFIEHWDSVNSTSIELEPIEFLKGLMKDNNLKAKNLESILSVSKGQVSKILNKQSGLSKIVIRKLSAYFKVSQEAFNRPYQLVHKVNRSFANANLMNTTKNIASGHSTARS
ncbi:MAG: type II toxin-antitoxin system HigA family antitoxin [Aureispira sp.]